VAQYLWLRLLAQRSVQAATTSLTSPQRGEVGEQSETGEGAPAVQNDIGSGGPPPPPPPPGGGGGGGGGPPPPLSGTKLGVLIDEFLPVPTFEGLRVPVRVLATDVDRGEPVVLREGDVRDAVRASCSFPGVFPPMVLNGRRLYDGGISEVVPVRLAREMAEETGVVVAVDVNSGTRWPAADSFVALALRAGLTLLRGRTRSELQGADLVIAPAMGDSGWMRPRKIPSFFAAGDEALTKALPELRRLLGG
jgi:NTE family protein